MKGWEKCLATSVKWAAAILVSASAAFVFAAALATRILPPTVPVLRRPPLLPPDLGTQLEDLLFYVWRLEKRERVYDRLEAVIR
jgi:hypothetical protein